MKPIKRILAPTDFSDRATRALKYAIGLSQATEAKLYILHAYRVPTAATGNPYPVTGVYVDTIASQEQIAKEVDQEFAEVELLHLKDKRLNYQFISTCSFPEEAIEEAIEEKEIDLVVMGNRGDSSIEKLLGSTTSHLFRRTDCPILAIPEDAIFSNVDSVLFATDYQQVDHANKFQGLISLASVFSARIDILHITPSDEKLTPEKLVVGQSLERVFRQVRHTYHHQQGEDVQDGLRRYLERHEEAGILALMPRDHTLWERLTKGSITNQVVFEADRPVLVFHS